MTAVQACLHCGQQAGAKWHCRGGRCRWVICNGCGATMGNWSHRCPSGSICVNAGQGFLGRLGDRPD